jgi:hypothetical protein
MANLPEGHYNVRIENVGAVRSNKGSVGCQVEFSFRVGNENATARESYWLTSDAIQIFYDAVNHFGVDPLRYDIPTLCGHNSPLIGQRATLVAYYGDYNGKPQLRWGMGGAPADNSDLERAQEVWQRLQQRKAPQNDDDISFP